MRSDTGKIVLWCLGGLVVAFVAAAISFSTTRSKRTEAPAATQTSDDAAQAISRGMTVTQPKAPVP